MALAARPPLRVCPHVCLCSRHVATLSQAWFQSGVIPPLGAPEYWTDAYTLFLSELVLMGFAETRRLQDYRKSGSQGEQFFLGLEAVFKGTEGQPAYPGGQFFNMAGLGKTEAEMKTLKTKEIKNGAPRCKPAGTSLRSDAIWRRSPGHAGHAGLLHPGELHGRGPHRQPAGAPVQPDGRQHPHHL